MYVFIGVNIWVVYCFILRFYLSFNFNIVILYLIFCYLWIEFKVKIFFGKIYICFNVVLKCRVLINIVNKNIEFI